MFDFEDWDIRVQATMFIWVAVAVIGIVTIVADDTSNNDVPILFLVALTAFLSTAAVWHFGGEYMLEKHRRNHESRESRSDKRHSRSRRPSSSEKQKRGSNNTSDSRMALLLSLMDDHEKADIKQRLLNDMRHNQPYDDHEDDDIPLSELLGDDGELRKRH